MRDDRPVWEDQFHESRDETAARWRRIKAERTAAGKCWQCARLIAECRCENVKHNPPAPTAGQE